MSEKPQLLTSLRERMNVPVREALLTAVVLLLVILFSRLSPHFLEAENLGELARDLSELGIVAIFQTFVILSAGIDLSVGSTLALSGVSLGIVFTRLHLPFPACACAALAVGTAAGLLNGIAIGGIGMPALVVTLATLAIYRGLAIGLSGGESVTGFPDSSSLLGQGSLGPAPYQFLLFIVIGIAAAIVLYRGSFGRSLIALGYSETTARLSGIAVSRVRLTVYALTGFAAGLAAIIHVSRLGTARADSGAGLELDVISAVVLGGTDVSGGEGGLAGTALGLLILGVLHNGLNLINFPSEGQSVIVGGLLILTIAIDRRLRRRT